MERGPSMSDTREHRETHEGAGRGARVEALGLCRYFQSITALEDLDLEIEPGERFGLLGANGAGKTTFIRLITGYLMPSAGDVQIDGISCARHPRAVQQRLGFVAESSSLYPELRVTAYLRFAGGIRGLAGDALEAAVDTALGQFELREVSGRLIGNLSKGFQQRVSLAQGFLHRPSLLIVDEPTTGLDPLQRGEVQETLERMGEERTILLCTHDLEEARRLTDRVAVLYQGRLVCIGPTHEILDGESTLELFRGRSGANA